MNEMSLAPEQSSLISPEGIKFARECLEKPVTKIFAEYGDHRTKVKNGETPYGTKWEPDDTVELASCTGQTPTKSMIEEADSIRSRLAISIEEERISEFIKKYREEIKSIDGRLLRSLGFKDKEAFTIDCLSGTEAEHVSFLFGVTKNIIQTETGSGTPAAASGKHSSAKSWRGEVQIVGDRIKGLEFVEKAEQLAVRNENTGSVRSEKEILSDMQKIYDINDNLDPKKDKQKLSFRLVAHSKTGEGASGDPAEIQKQMPNALIMVDAAQMRLSPEEIHKAVDAGCVVFITGSKFPGGPIFSCKVLMNETRKNEVVEYVKDNKVPEGLSNYFTSFDLERVIGEDNKNNNMPKIPNIPALLKWGAVMPTIEKYFKIPREDRGRMIKQTKELVTGAFDIEDSLFTIDGIKEEDRKGSVHEPNPIISFRILKNTKYYSTKEDLQVLHWLLNHDTSLPFNNTKDEDIKKILTTKYHLGQPVQEGSEPACLRIAPSMDWYYDMWQKINEIGEQKAIVEKTAPILDSITKTNFLLENWSVARKFYNEQVNSTPIAK